MSADHVLYLQPSIGVDKYHAVRVQIYAEPHACMHVIRLDQPAASQISAGCRPNIQAEHAYEKYSLFPKIVVPSFFSLTKYTHDYQVSIATKHVS